MKISKKIGVLASSVVLAAGMAVASPLSAQAVTGGNLTHACASEPLSIKTWVSSSSYVWTPRCTTTKGSTWAGKVQGFMIVASGCEAKSQYSGSAWPYKSGNYYPYSSNNLDLTITVRCFI